MKDLSREKLLRRFSYDTSTGNLIWKAARAGYQGKFAGSLNSYGYRQIRIYPLGNMYAHRIVWIMHRGSIPAGLYIDHINGVRHDNRLENLRLVTYAQNNRNVARKRNNSSGVPGVRRGNRAWVATINQSGTKGNWLGTFKTKAEAIAARRRAERLHAYDRNHGKRRGTMT